MADKVCAKCGKVHERCAAHKMNVRPWEPCNAYPPPGARVCKMHGANAGGKGRAHNIALREARAQAAAAREILATYGQPVKTDPKKTLLELIFWSAGHVQWLRQKVQETSPDDLIWGTTEHVESTEDVKTKEVAAPSVWLKLYNEERKLLAEICDKALRNNIEAKRIEIAERMGDQLLRFAEIFATKIQSALVEEGWVAEELEEVWQPVLSKVIPRALEASKEVADV